jgi:lysozyme family protein
MERAIAYSPDWCFKLRHYPQQGFQDCLAFTLAWEGGFADNLLDSGGATQAGITLATFRCFKNDADLSSGDLQAISDADLQTIYRTLYWDKIAGDSLPEGIALMVFDMAVNAGVAGSSRILQQVLGVAVDGVLGSHTIAALAGRDPVQLVNALAAAQTAYYRSRASFVTFGQGWLNRVVARQTAALAMITLAQATQPPPVELRT